MFKRTASGYSEGSVFASLFRSRGVQMGKSAILKKIHNAAKNYQRYLAGKTFMYVYEGKSIEVVFKNSSFLHLTGVNTKLRAKEFYKHAKTKNGLKVQEFFFDKNHPYDLAEKKTDHLEDLYRITNMEVLITEDVVTFTANYKIGITDLQFILLCGENRDKHGKLIDDCFVPYSFRIEEIRNEKFGELYEVDFIFCKQTNAAKYEIISYKGDKEIDTIPEEIRLKISDDLI